MLLSSSQIGAGGELGLAGGKVELGMGGEQRPAGSLCGAGSVQGRGPGYPEGGP